MILTNIIDNDDNNENLFKNMGGEYSGWKFSGW